jgi:type II secretory pathway pseudopilin PulG
LIVIGQKEVIGLKVLRNSKGFTLIELVLIILILGLLAVTAIPKFLDMQQKAKDAAEKGVAGAVRGGISIYYASTALYQTSASFPSSLDAIAANQSASSSNLFFNTVLEPGVDADWAKGGATTTYVYVPTQAVYTYTSSTGRFTK